VTPEAVELSKKVPPLTEELVPLIRENEGPLAVMLANLVSPMQIMSARTPALEHGFVVIPQSFHDLASIADGDTANFEFVVTQGPICYYDNERRTPQETGQREPKLTYHCPSELPVRGATNAPRPDDDPTDITIMDPATGRADTPDGPVRFGVNGGQSRLLGEDSWQAVYLQGIEGLDLSELDLALAEDPPPRADGEQDRASGGGVPSDDGAFPVEPALGAGALVLMVAAGLFGGARRWGS
jgi:phospholipid/cholesterol/gamma-HCH transport system substrate-binding protein